MPFGKATLSQIIPFRQSFDPRSPFAWPWKPGCQSVAMTNHSSLETFATAEHLISYRRPWNWGCFMSSTKSLAAQAKNLMGFSVLLLLHAAARCADYADIAPIFQEHCVLCHSGPGAPLGLRLDSPEGVRKGSQNGPVAVPGNAAGSELIRRIRGERQPRMPLTGPPWLTAAQITQIAGWIDAGMAGSDAAPRNEAAPVSPAPGEPVTFAHVERIFLQRCIKCHKDDGKLGPPPEGLRLTDYESILMGNERLVVVPRNPGASKLLRRVKELSDPRMPFDGPPWLPEADIDLLERWIADGARDEAGQAATLPSGAAVRLEGRLTERWVLDDMPFIVTGSTRLKKSPRVGDWVELRGVIRPDGHVEATRLRPREEKNPR